nr:nucleotidyltransferase family protein [uncultured Psychrobacter sp.]
MMMQNHAVIILASGLSQRLGQTKQLLKKEGEPLICYMTQLALATQPQVIMMVTPQGNLSIDTAIKGMIDQQDNVHRIINPTPDTGMAHSLYLGIEALNHLDSNDSLSINRVLIMGIDQILLDKEHLQALLVASQRVVASRYSSLNNWSDEQNSDRTVTHNTVKKDIVGLPLVIDYELLNQWQALLTGDKGLRHLIRGLPADQISSVVNPQLSYDIDTPYQLAHARAQRWIDIVESK